MLNSRWLQIILTLLTNVPALIAEVEAADPKVPGEGKKLIVMDKIVVALKGLDPIVGPLLAGDPAILAGFGAAVDVAVDLFNGSVKVVEASGVATSATIGAAGAGHAAQAQLDPTRSGA
jgi:hypothetical protein